MRTVPRSHATAEELQVPRPNPAQHGPPLAALALEFATRAGAAVDRQRLLHLHSAGAVGCGHHSSAVANGALRAVRGMPPPRVHSARSKLLYLDLCEEKLDAVLVRMRMLPWDASCTDMVLEALLKVPRWRRRRRRRRPSVRVSV